MYMHTYICTYMHPQESETPVFTYIRTCMLMAKVFLSGRLTYTTLRGLLWASSSGNPFSYLPNAQIWWRFFFQVLGKTDPGWSWIVMCLVCDHHVEQSLTIVGHPILEQRKSVTYTHRAFLGSYMGPYKHFGAHIHKPFGAHMWAHIQKPPPPG